MSDDGCEKPGKNEADEDLVAGDRVVFRGNRGEELGLLLQLDGLRQDNKQTVDHHGDEHGVCSGC